ncbi:MAG TPA: adenylate/guanylate cyclase domain-containing protein [Candidatus Polarisedimenticolia bacterium]|nr:adenylate/guanylate cyclase domain-containing protein [Candidatus Polarisedimenticolia bacterium]
MQEQPPVSAAVLFADVADSTQLYEELGDSLGRTTLLDCLRIVSGAIQESGGRVLQRIGDEVLAIFPSPESCAQGSVLVQEAVQRAQTRVRIGFHWGPVLLEGDQVFGSTVHVAHRMASLAKAGQILTTAETMDVLPRHVCFRTRDLGGTRIKGQSAPVALVEIVWDPGGATMNDPPMEVPNDLAALQLRWQEEACTVDAFRPRITLGRDASCDLVIAHERVSRLHARVELRTTGFHLVDLSTNGSTVEHPDESPTWVRRAELRLGSRGAIVLGTGNVLDGSCPRLSFQVFLEE